MSAPAEQQYGQGDERSAQEAFVQCPMPVAIYDAELRVVRASRGLARESGLADDGVRGLRGVGMLLGPAGAEVEERIRRVFATGEAEQSDVAVDSPADGRPRVWAVTVSPLRDPAGQVYRVQLTAVDVTELHLARDRLAVLN